MTISNGVIFKLETIDFFLAEETIEFDKAQKANKRILKHHKL